MSIDPKILKRMYGEDAFLQSQSRSSRRVKLERGQNWIVRFLPAQMGPDGLWFARIAKHWMNKLPIVCPRNTAEDFGGDPECECPVCTVAEELNDSGDEVISKFGYRAKSNAQYLTYCIVWEKDGTEQPMSEILNPYEFNHYRSTFEELKGFYLAGGRRCPNSVLDYEKGNDFSVNRTGKGLRLDKQDSSPIFEATEPKYAEWIKKIEAAMKTPKLTIPTDDQLQLFAHKLQAAADRGGFSDDDDSPRGRRSHGRSRHVDDESQFRRSRRQEPEEEDDLPYDDAPLARPARRSAPEPDEPSEEPRRRSAPVDNEPATTTRRRVPIAEEEEPAPRRRRVAAEEDDEPAPRRSAPVEGRRVPPAEDEEPAPRRRAAATEEPVARRRSPEPEPSARRPASEEPEDAGEPLEDNSGAEPLEGVSRRRELEPTARRAREAAGAREATGAPPQGDPEEDDPLPEDDKDTVPPAGKEEDAPTPVARRGSEGTDIKARIARVRNT